MREKSEEGYFLGDVFLLSTTKVKEDILEEVSIEPSKPDG